MRIGVVGAGNMGAMHARAWAGMAGATLAGVCGASTARSAQLAAELGVRCYQRYDDLLADQGVEVVDVCAPTRAHARIAVAAMEAGKHAILEFPVCLDAGELEALRAAGREHARLCMVAYTARCQCQYRRVFEAASSGSLGSITGLHISRMSQRCFSGDDIVNDLVSQDVDFMARLLGRPRGIRCAAHGRDHALFLFDYGSFTATIEGRTDMHPGFPFSTRHFVCGVQGSVDLTWRFTEQGPAFALEVGTRNGIERIACEDRDPYLWALERILSAVREGRADADLSLESVVEPARLAFECREAYRSELALAPRIPDSR